MAPIRLHRRQRAQPAPAPTFDAGWVELVAFRRRRAPSTEKARPFEPGIVPSQIPPK
jgi:hypothetical protein